MCVYIHIHAASLSHTYIYIYIQHVRTYIYIYIYTYNTYAYIYIYIYIYMYVHICICIYIYIYIHTYIHTYIHRSGRLQPPGPAPRRRGGRKASPAGWLLFPIIHVYLFVFPVYVYDFLLLLIICCYFLCIPHEANRTKARRNPNKTAPPFTLLIYPVA